MKARHGYIYIGERPNEQTALTPLSETAALAASQVVTTEVVAAEHKHMNAHASTRAGGVKALTITAT